MQKHVCNQSQKQNRKTAANIHKTKKHVATHNHEQTKMQSSLQTNAKKMQNERIAKQSPNKSQNELQKRRRQVTHEKHKQQICIISL